MPKIVDHEKYRKELLWKSFDLFASKGYASVTMREIAKELGVSTGTLYHYFPNKEAIFLQLVEEQYQQEIINFLAEAGDIKYVPERIRALVNFTEKNEEYFINQILLWSDFYQQQGKSEVLNNEILKQVAQKMREELLEYLEIQDKTIADFVVNFLNGLICVRMFEGEMVSYEEQGELLVKMVSVYLGNG
ncbi:TetR/AcrR family transcriptional regulator [Calothrix sp. CCY 0018]|uniref:TetR/AcrR family transcriptional regulator n=1 Tax=Calothrix sp. CCY 0018 TaxID=3103864 RepID=UPI0039C5F82D